MGLWQRQIATLNGNKKRTVFNYRVPYALLKGKLSRMDIGATFRKM